LLRNLADLFSRHFTAGRSGTPAMASGVQSGVPPGRTPADVYGLGHGADDRIVNLDSGLLEFIEGDGFIRHTLKAAVKSGFMFFSYLRTSETRGSELEIRLDEERRAKRVVDAFVAEQIAQVEEVARMLPVEGGTSFPP